MSAVPCAVSTLGETRGINSRLLDSAECIVKLKTTTPLTVSPLFLLFVFCFIPRRPSRQNTPLSTATRGSCTTYVRSMPPCRTGTRYYRTTCAYPARRVNCWVSTNGQHMSRRKQLRYMDREGRNAYAAAQCKQGYLPLENVMFVYGHAGENLEEGKGLGDPALVGFLPPFSLWWIGSRGRSGATVGNRR